MIKNKLYVCILILLVSSEIVPRSFFETTCSLKDRLIKSKVLRYAEFVASGASGIFIGYHSVQLVLASLENLHDNYRTSNSCIDLFRGAAGLYAALVILEEASDTYYGKTRKEDDPCLDKALASGIIAAGLCSLALDHWRAHEGKKSLLFFVGALILGNHGVKQLR